MFVRCSHVNVSTFSASVSARGVMFSANVSWASAMFVRRRCYVFESLHLEYAWQRALQQAGIRDFRFHDLRHSAASYLAMNGASLMEIAVVLGHKTLDMVRCYAHLTDAHVDSVVRQMNAKIFGGLAPEEALEH
jgi:integrase